MKSLYILLSFALFALQAQAQSLTLNEESIDLEALYEELDEAIGMSTKYVADRERQIAATRDSLRKADSPEKRVQMSEQLYQLYRYYRNDSALHYIEQCVELSDSLRRPDLAGRYRSMLASQCSNTDMEAESLEQLQLVRRTALDKKGLVEYYKAWMHLYGELASYTQRNGMHRSYLDQQDLYRDSVMMVADEGSEEWLHLKMDILCAQRHFQDALTVNNKWIKSVKNGTHESAFASFYRSQVFHHLNNYKMTCYWLGRSALDDIRSGIMDQASLLFLAERLVEDGDYDRAMRYMAFSRSCNQTFSPHLRAYQLKSIIHVIEKDGKAAHERLSLILIGAGIAVLVLLIALIIVIVRRRKRNQS